MTEPDRPSTFPFDGPYDPDAGKPVANGPATAWTCACHPNSYWGFRGAFTGCPITDISPTPPVLEDEYGKPEDLILAHVGVTEVAWEPVLRDTPVVEPAETLSDTGDLGGLR